MAKQKLLAPSETVWWVPSAGFSNWLTPTSAEINAGTNLSCAIATGYTMNPTDSDTDATRSICDNSNVKTATFDNYEVDVTFFRGDLADPVTVYTSAFTLFKQAGAIGYFVRRIGKINSANAASGDDVSIFGVESDWPSVEEAENGGPIQLHAIFLPTGQYNGHYTLLS